MTLKIKVYSPQNIISLVVVFFLVFFLLYQIGSFLYESSKIDREIEKIRQSNIQMKKEIERKQRELRYLKTPERIEKEAKIQMAKKEEGEKVLVFVKEKPNLLPTEKKREERKKVYTWPNWKKWQWVFFGNR